MSHLIHFIRGGGVLMIPLLLLSLGAITVIFERFLAFRALGTSSPGLLQQVLQLSREKRFDEAMARCDASRGPLAASLSTVLKHRDRPVAVAERHVEEVGQEFFIRLERLLPFLDTTTTISPLLGLLGTLFGMIGTFNAIAMQGQVKGNSDAVLSGVGEALYATATGITIAVVCFVAYNGFAARLRTITAETEQGATKLINALIDQRAGFFPEQEREKRREVEENHAVQAATRA